MTNRTDKNGLQVADELVTFIEEQALPGTGVDPAAFWAGFSDLVHTMGPRNRDLLRIREDMQAKIDALEARLGREQTEHGQDQADQRDRA